MESGKSLRSLALLMCRLAMESKTMSFMSITDDVASSQHRMRAWKVHTHTKWDPPTIEHSFVPDDGDGQSSAQSQPVPPPLLSLSTPSVLRYPNRNRQHPEYLRFYY